MKMKSVMTGIGIGMAVGGAAGLVTGAMGNPSTKKMYKKKAAKALKVMENMFDDDPELLKQLAIRMKNEPRFGVCFDLAHAYISNTPLPEWISELATYARHWHINDNDKLQDSHHPVGSMQLPWDLYEKYTEALPKEKRPSVLLEVRRYEDLEASVKYMEEHDMYPFC